MIVQMFWNCLKKIHKADSYSCKCVPSKMSPIGITQINKFCDCGLADIARSSPVIHRTRSIPVLNIDDSLGSSEDEVSGNSKKSSV